MPIAEKPENQTAGVFAGFIIDNIARSPKAEVGWQLPCLLKKTVILAENPLVEDASLTGKTSFKERIVDKIKLEINSLSVITNSQLIKEFAKGSRRLFGRRGRRPRSICSACGKVYIVSEGHRCQAKASKIGQFTFQY